MSQNFARFGVLALVLLGLCLAGGCPTTGGLVGALLADSNSAGTGSGAIEKETALKVTQTQIAVRFDASLKVGDDLIAFGTDNFTGVGYVIPSTKPSEATRIAGAYRNAGFAVAGTKLLLFAAQSKLTVYDTATK